MSHFLQNLCQRSLWYSDTLEKCPKWEYSGQLLQALWVNKLILEYNFNFLPNFVNRSRGENIFYFFSNVIRMILVSCRSYYALTARTLKDKSHKTFNQIMIPRDYINTSRVRHTIYMYANLLQIPKGKD